MFDFCLVTPVYSGVSGVTCHCVENAHHILPQQGITFQWYIGAMGHGDALISRGRSTQATQFMEGGPSDYMIFLDSDIIFTPKDLRMLSEDLREGYDLVAGAYPTRSGTQLASHWWDGKCPVGELGVYEAQYISTGFMGISKKLLKRMVEELKLPALHPNDAGRSFPFFESRRGWVDTPDDYGAQHVWLSEDWDFCEKAKEIGVKSYLDCRIQLQHLGERVVTFQDVEEHQLGKLRAKQRASRTIQDWVGASSTGAKC